MLLRCYLLALIVCCQLMPSFAQNVYTKNGTVSFFSKATLENITAKTNEVTSVFNQQTGEIQFSILIKSFRFKKSLMEQHFNENYMESGKFPKAIFKGQIIDFNKLNLATDGTYKVKVIGDLTMHGVTKKITSDGEIAVRNGLPHAQSTFNVTLSDYRISVPAIVRNNIAKTVAITVSCLYNQKL